MLKRTLVPSFCLAVSLHTFPLPSYFPACCLLDGRPSTAWSHLKDQLSNKCGFMKLFPCCCVLGRLRCISTGFTTLGLREIRPPFGKLATATFPESNINTFALSCFSFYSGWTSKTRIQRSNNWNRAFDSILTALTDIKPISYRAAIEASINQQRFSSTFPNQASGIYYSSVARASSDPGPSHLACVGWGAGGRGCFWVSQIISHRLFMDLRHESNVTLHPWLALGDEGGRWGHRKRPNIQVPSS